MNHLPICLKIISVTFGQSHYRDVIMSMIVSPNHQPCNCLPNRVFRCRSMKMWKRRVTGLWAGNSPEIGEFPAQMSSNAKKWLSEYRSVKPTSRPTRDWCMGSPHSLVMLRSHIMLSPYGHRTVLRSTACKAWFFKNRKVLRSTVVVVTNVTVTAQSYDSWYQKL